jgi:hypothetical protein
MVSNLHFYSSLDYSCTRSGKKQILQFLLIIRFRDGVDLWDIQRHWVRHNLLLSSQEYPSQSSALGLKLS